MAPAATNTSFAPESAHDALAEALASTFPAQRLIRDPLRTLAYGTDASFYRLIPKMVVVVEDEREMAALLRQCRRFGTPVTFRAAGTSLSGQAVTDSVLVVLGDGWNGVEIAAERRHHPAEARRARRRRQPPARPASAARSAPIRRRSTPARSAASPPTTPAACAAAPPEQLPHPAVDAADPGRRHAARHRRRRQPRRLRPPAGDLARAAWPGWRSAPAPTRRWRSASGASSRSRTPPATASTRWSISPIRSTSSST